MAKRSDNYKESYLYKSLLKPGEAAAYLSAAIEEAQETGDHDIFLLALKDVATAYRMAQVAKKTGLSRTSLYKALSKDADPRFSTILKALTAMHLKLGFQKTDTGIKAA